MISVADATQVPLALVRDAGASPREQLPDVDALADNIESYGLLQPICVRRVGGGYELVSGHRRVAAVRLLHERHPHDQQWLWISAVVMRADTETATLALCSAQMHVAPWSSAEEATVLAHLGSMGLSMTEIGDALGRTESWTSRRTRLYADQALSGPVQAGLLAPGVAEELLPLPLAARTDLGGRAVAEHWSQQRTRSEVACLRSVRRPSPNERPATTMRAIRHRARALAATLRGLERREIPSPVLADLLELATLIEQRCTAPTAAAA